MGHSASAPRLRGALLRIVAAALVALPLVVVTGWNTAGQAAELTPIGRLERMPKDALAKFGKKIDVRDPYQNNALMPTVGTLLAVPSRRQLWQLFPYYAAGARTAIAVRSMDSLKIVHTMDLPIELQRGAFARASEWLHTIDVRGDRLFMHALSAVDGDNGLVSFNLKTFAMTRHGSAFLDVGPNDLNIGGLTYDPHSDSVLVLVGYYQLAPGADLFTLIYRHDLKTGRWDSAPRTVRSCTGPLPSANTGFGTSFPIYIADARHAYVVCQRAGLSGTVVKLDRAKLMDSTSPEEMAVGPVSLTSMLTDPGSGRLFLVTLSRDVWAFDTKTMSYVGVIGTNSDRRTLEQDMVGYGIDPTSGRLYFLSPTYGLGFAEGRFFPLPQARTDVSRASEGHEQLISDPKSRRLFVLAGDDKRAPAYEIFRTQVPPAPPAPPDPDANTINRAEQAGVTDARFAASASGYGVRLLFANGVATTLPAPGVGEVNPIADTLTGNIVWRCGFSDREMVAGRVAKAQLDTYSGAAEAIAVDLDGRTRADIEQPSRCDAVVRDRAGTERFPGLFGTAPELKKVTDQPEDTPDDKRRFAHYPAACSSSSGEQAVTAAGRDSGQALGTSAVTCPGSGSRLSARAAAGLVGTVSVDATWSEVSIERTKAGLVSTVTSVAQDLRIGDLVRIAEIRASSRSVANGRPQGKDMSNYTVVFRGVSLPGLSCAVCDADAVIGALNTALAGRGQARSGLSSADARLRKGSPRGALTAVQKSPERQASDRALLGDFSTEVPALEIVVYNDNNQWGRARQVYQFAGVATASNYNIVLQPKGAPAGHVPQVEVPTDVVAAPEVPQGIGPAAGPAAPQTPEALPAAGVSGLRRLVRAALDGARLLMHSPREAALMFTVWLLLTLPVVLARRRSLLPAGA